jgi:hypothetical protein
MDKDEFRCKFFEGIKGYGFSDDGKLVAVKGYINSRSTGDME